MNKLKKQLYSGLSKSTITKIELINNYIYKSLIKLNTLFKLNIIFL